MIIPSWEIWRLFRLCCFSCLEPNRLVTRIRPTLRGNPATILLCAVLACAPALSGPIDRGQPPIPASMNLPEDTSVAIVGAGVRPSTYYRNVVAVQFEGTASGQTIRRFLRTFRGTIIGGMSLDESEPGYYVVQVPDPGTSWDEVNTLLDHMEQAVGVRSLFHMQVRGTIDIRARDQGFPSEVPDTVPEWVYADSNLVVEDTFITGIYPRGILVVVFTRTSTVEERGALTRSINAEVIGGRPGIVTRGGRSSDWYFLRLRGDRSSVAMEAAREKLENSPHVEIAMFDFRVDLM